MNRPILEKAFSKFGAVRNVDVVLAKVMMGILIVLIHLCPQMFT
jgi:hypothetical protein